MGVTRRRRYRRPPVLSRLTLAWLCACSVLAILAGVFIHSASSERGPGRVALALDDIEFFAREQAKTDAAEERLESPPDGLRLSAPDLRENDTPQEGFAIADNDLETNDSLLYPEEFPSTSVTELDQPVGDIVITIDGALQGAAAPINASLTPVVTAIPDPDPALLRATPLGKIPRIAPDGRKSMTAYARPFENPQGAARIAVIVGGLGLNSALTERAIDELPPEISLAFAPYAKDLEFWTRKARKAGHEVLIELPMEGYGDSDQALGAAALLSSRTPQENLQRLDWLLARFGGYFAATNYMGAKFSSDTEALTPVLKKLGDAGVAYIDDTGAARAAIAAAPVTWTTVNRMIPPSPDDSGRRAVRRELNALEKIAARDGAALGKTYAYSATLDEIIKWAETIEDKNLVAAPASAVLQARIATR